VIYDYHDHIVVTTLERFLQNQPEITKKIFTGRVVYALALDGDTLLVCGPSFAPPKPVEEEANTSTTLLDLEL
jgi:hypothetical protein